MGITVQEDIEEAEFMIEGLPLRVAPQDGPTGHQPHVAKAPKMELGASQLLDLHGASPVGSEERFTTLGVPSWVEALVVNRDEPLESGYVTAKFSRDEVLNGGLELGVGVGVGHDDQ